MGGGDRLGARRELGCAAPGLGADAEGARAFAVASNFSGRGYACRFEPVPGSSVPELPRLLDREPKPGIPGQGDEFSRPGRS